MMGYGVSPFGFIFMLLYVAVVVFTIAQLAGINKSLQRIAEVLEERANKNS